jgi:LacI family transcriptional regulator
MPVKTPATAQDVARQAGVTQITVSRAFSGKAPVADKTRRRIMAAADALGYRPHVSARATRTGRTGYIGMIRSAHKACSVLVPDFEAGLDAALHQRGLCLVRDTITDEVALGDADESKLPRIVREKAVDGLLINYVFGTPPAVREMIDRCRVPSIWINRKREHNCVRPADHGGAYEATMHLIRHGHTRIAMAHDERSLQDLAHGEPHYANADRLAGYAQAMRDAGLVPRFEQLTRPSPGEYLPGYRVHVCEKFLRQPDRPTAVLCGDNQGRAMVAAAWRLGLRVPADLSVITFDNDAGADQELAVDRVLIRFRKIGEAAVGELCELISHPGTPRAPVVVPLEFHRVGTVAEPGS